jgi:hypothetical protein
MIREIPIQFCSFDFNRCYFQGREWRSPEDIEAQFEYQVMKWQPLLCDPRRGPVISMELWNPLVEKTSAPPTQVILQVLSLHPFKWDYSLKTEHILHEMVLVPWTCKPDTFFAKAGKQRYRLGHRNRKEFKIYLILNREVTVSVLHLYMSQHLGIILNQDLYEELIVNSDELSQRIEGKIELGDNLYSGSTRQKACDNACTNDRAKGFSNVFDFIDIAYSTIQGQVLDPELQNIRLLVSPEICAVHRWPDNPFDDDE